MTIRKTIFGEDHADVATSYNNLASVYNRLGQYNQAKGLYEKALTIRKQIFGEDHKYVERIRSELALVNKHLVQQSSWGSARESMLFDPINCLNWQY